MSATRDKGQKIGWSYSNIYRIYKDSSEEKPSVNTFEPCADIKNNIKTLEELSDKLKEVAKQIKEN